MWFSFLYEAVMFIMMCAYLPHFLYQIIYKKKYRQSALLRLGFGFPRIEKQGPLIWIHAVSVGEAQAICELAKKLKEEIADLSLIISSVTETGHREAKRILPFADYHVFLPYDFYI